MATANLLSKILAHQNWPCTVCADVTNHPPQLAFCWCPTWANMTPIDISAQWKKRLSSSPVVNNVLFTDLTIWPPGFDLPRQSWLLLNSQIRAAVLQICANRSWSQLISDANAVSNRAWHI